MLNIRSVSDLCDNFPEMEKSVLETGEPVYLTRDGCGSMVLVNVEQFDRRLDPLDDAPPWTDDPSSPFCTDVEAIMDYADRMEEETDVRYSLDEVIDYVRRSIRGREAV